MELLNEIWQTARHNKLRTTLTGFAVAWGIFMLIVLLGAGNGVIHSQEDSMNRYLNKSMDIYGGMTSNPHKGMPKGRKITLNRKDHKATHDNFTDHIDEVEATVSCYVTMSLGKEFFETNMEGVQPNHIRIKKEEVLCGRFINEIDIRQERKVVVLSRRQGRDLGGGNYASLLGRHVKVNGIMFLVVGIFKEDENSWSKYCYAPVTTLQTMYALKEKLGSIKFSFHGLSTVEENELFEKEYRKQINAIHSAAPDDESSIWISNNYFWAMKMDNIHEMMRLALWIVGLLTLVSGIVGVSNIMLISVKERTHEFGIRKAIGAKPWSILQLIVTESVIITSIFGYIGMVLGILVNEYLDATFGHSVMDMGAFKGSFFVNPTVGFDICIEAVIVVIIAGVLAGLMPAYKAARVRPIEALRKE